mmetsp:Transcript_6442/g.21721  ORF Transcript_6442/g.21721 Transcript_6442/m.21721 type:complete len:292 (-) Transcript_6442:86-961(-)
MSEPDELFSLRSQFWLGSYQLALNEASALTRLSPALRAEKDEFVYRCYIAMGQYQIAIDEISSAAPAALQAVKLLATYLSTPDSLEVALLQLQEWMTDPSSANSTTLQLVTALVHMHADNLPEAIRAVRHGSTMEHCALLVQLYLRMDRPDLAQRQLRHMQEADDDHTLSQLSAAWVACAVGGEKLQEAVFAFEELVDKSGGSALLFNGLAVANMQLGNWEDAERNLKEALGKSSNDPDTLANLVTVSQHTGKDGSRYLSQLRSVSPHHPLLRGLATVEGAFDRVAAASAV